MWFEVVLDLRINLEKSELISIGRVENIDDVALDFCAFFWVHRLNQ